MVGASESPAALVVVESDPVVRNQVVLRVGAASPAQATASAISHAVYDGKRVVLRAIGAGAVNQAMKACVIARGYTAQRGVDLVVRPGFTEVVGSLGDELSAMIFVVVPQ